MTKTTLAFDFPTGVIVPHADSVVPSGWVACDGTAYDGTTEVYKPLWLLIGVTYGGTGQSSFRVPSLGGRVPAGVKSTTSGAGLDGPVGAWGGATATTLTSGQTGVPTHGHSSTWDGSTGDPGHSHASTYSSHTHAVGYNSSQVDTKEASTATARHDGGNPLTYGSGFSNTAVTMAAATIGGVSTSNNGSSNASSSHTNTQPQLALTYLIKL